MFKAPYNSVAQVTAFCAGFARYFTTLARVENVYSFTFGHASVWVSEPIGSANRSIDVRTVAF